MGKFQPADGNHRKLLVEEIPAFDLRQCRQAISLDYPIIWCISWPEGWRMQYELERDEQGRPEAVTLSYEVAHGDGVIQPRTQRVLFERIAIRRGGYSYWLTCQCGRRARQLHLKPGTYDWRCIRCCDLLWRSQLQRNTRLEHLWGPIDRALREERKPLHFPAMPADPKPFTPTL